MIQQTSIDAYKSILFDLGDRQKLIYDTIEKHPYSSNQDIADIVGLQINQVTPRVKELRNYGLVIQIGVKVDKVTNREVMTWMVRD